MTCNQLIKENKKTIINFEEFIKAKTENPNNDDNYEYIESYCHTLFTQINKTIIALDIQKCTIIEKNRLHKQFEELYNLYFNKLAANTNYFGWSNVENHSQDFFDYEKSFIEPDKFTTDYILEVISKLGFNLVIKPQKEKPWFEVGIEFANGKVYELNNDAKGLKGIKLKNEIFGETASDKYRSYLDCTLDNTQNVNNKQKNIFARTNAEAELKEVIEHCKKNNIAIHEKFKEECRKIYIDI